MAAISKVVISGSIAIDRLMHFDGAFGDYIHRDKLEKLSISLFLDSLHDARGGVGANIAYSMALLGESPVLLGSVGPDAGSYLSDLSSQGVDISHVHQSKLPTATFNVITDREENQFGGFYPGAMFDSKELLLSPWQGQNVIVVVSPHDPDAMRRQVNDCKQWNLRLFYDVGQQVSNIAGEDIAEGLAAANVLIANEYEMEALAAKVMRTVERIKSEVPIVITTLGKDGSAIEGKSVPQPVRIEAVSPDRFRDPTGAGDAYRAGFLYGLARDWDMRVCGQLGATVAAYAVEHSGTQEHTFDLAQVSTRYQDTFHEPLPQSLTTKG